MLVSLEREVSVQISKKRIAIVLAFSTCLAGAAVQLAAGQGRLPAPSPQAVADSTAVPQRAAPHAAALFEEFRTTTPENARINSRAISNLFRWESADAARHEWRLRVQQSARPITKFEADALQRSRLVAGSSLGSTASSGWLWCEAIVLNNGAFLQGTNMNPNVCQTCHASFPTDTTALVGSLNHCDVVK